MTDLEIIETLLSGERPTFGCHGRNGEVMDLMHRLETAGLIQTEDMGLSQETRRRAWWVGPKDAKADDVLQQITPKEPTDDQ